MKYTAAPEYAHQKKETDTGEDNNKYDNSNNEWIKKGRMFKRYHSKPTNTQKSNENIKA